MPRKNAGPGAPDLRLIPGGGEGEGDGDDAPALDDIDVGLLIGSIYQDLAGQVRQAIGPLDAELTVSGWLGVMTATITVGTPPGEADDATTAFLTSFVDHAHEQGSPEALALLRTLAALAPTGIAEQAGRAALDLAARDVRDRPWAGSLGHPMIGRCWQYGDLTGQQVSVNLTFEYGQGAHLVSVLIDHGLGGGVKDCWIGDAPALAWQQINELAANDPDVVVTPLPWTDARDQVVAALQRPACPVDDDQVQDVAEFMAVVRSRLARLGGRTGTGPRGRG